MRRLAVGEPSEFTSVFLAKFLDSLAKRARRALGHENGAGQIVSGRAILPRNDSSSTFIGGVVANALSSDIGGLRRTRGSGASLASPCDGKAS
jgi:hypothetical protein